MPSVLSRFIQHIWDGNIREVENIVERLVITGENVITEEDLPLSMQQASLEQEGKSLYEMLEEVEKNIILKAYKKCKSSYKVAELLKISQSSATRKIKKYVENS
ncbi:transcriptional regulator with PAS, ATPase and Fis domain [Bacillus alveayuensis]|uniref:Transcriptional regulator with PAS, ATPase and Fis domain n=1 Tax=Aeribacillus alveayuensis TaxID=279215 RepID=A0ABT9VMQ6_9BACI|nr:transcriptional regulator with PAS, ATPase and Fis domain [Bacillus alveayuensis]